MIDYSKFQHCLRMQITCDLLCGERIPELVKHCKKYGFTNVMLMINAEEFNIGHITLEEAKPWVAILKEAKKMLEAESISISLNSWITIGHLDRARKLKPGQNFTNIKDMNGDSPTLVACPLCEEWLAYYLEYAKYLVRELRPEVYWIEDDFRYHNHGGCDKNYDFFCFCEKHMQEYNRRLNKNYTSKELVAKIFAEGPCTEERRVWLDVRHDSMISLAQKISGCIRETNPETEIGLMSSTPEAHCTEAREWDLLLEKLSGGGHKILRPHLSYTDDQGKVYCYEFNRNAMVVRAFCSDDTVILPEIELGSANVYDKDPRFLQFRVEASIPLCLDGMTYSIYDFVGNGAVEAYGYGKVLKEITPYLQAATDLNLRFSSLCGVVVPIDERSSYNIDIKTDGMDLRDIGLECGPYLSSLGVTYRYSKDKHFKGETVALFYHAVINFADEELTELFENNYVIVDGGCVLELQARGLLHLVGIVSAENRGTENGYLTYEEATGDRKVCGITHFRATGRVKSGEYVKIEYANPNVEVLSYVYNEREECLAKGYVRNEKGFVIPYVFKKKLNGHYNALRVALVKESIWENSKTSLMTERVGINPYLYIDGEKVVLILVNSTLENYEETVFYVKNIRLKRLFEIQRDGTISEVSYAIDESGRVVLKEGFDLLSTKIFIIK